MRLSNGELEDELIMIMQEIDTITASKTARNEKWGRSRGFGRNSNKNLADKSVVSIRR